MIWSRKERWNKFVNGWKHERPASKPSNQKSQMNSFWSWDLYVTVFLYICVCVRALWNYSRFSIHKSYNFIWYSHISLDFHFVWTISEWIVSSSSSSYAKCIQNKSEKTNNLQTNIENIWLYWKQHVNQNDFNVIYGNDRKLSLSLSRSLTLTLTRSRIHKNMYTHAIRYYR